MIIRRVDVTSFENIRSLWNKWPTTGKYLIDADEFLYLTAVQYFNVTISGMPYCYYYYYYDCFH